MTKVALLAVVATFVSGACYAAFFQAATFRPAGGYVTTDAAVVLTTDAAERLLAQ